MVRSVLRPTLVRTVNGSEAFQLELRNRFAALETTADVDKDLEGVTRVLREVGVRHFKSKRGGQKSKLSAETLELMKIRREMPKRASSDTHRLNKEIRKSVRRDLRNYNKQLIKNAIEQNRGSKVFAKRLGRSHLTKLKNSEGKTVTSVPAILAEVESFYQKLYASHAPKPPPDANDPRATLTRHFTDDLPEVDEDEIERALKQLQNEKAPGEDGITTELLKAGGTLMLRILKELQGDVISPKLFSNALEDVFKTLDWNGLGINVNGVYLSHLRFAVDIVLMAESLQDLQKMLHSLNAASMSVGLRMNLDKTKVMFNDFIIPI
ncbi:hypothetical protein ABMA27_002732 [Loxostege sticticalis]|uniref:Reverse transcriptase domain-containing protein n=1 Tax=Loxostege sticticalis TaxID=481309 RepID=A0ABR3HUN7_LOXSC